ncbi:MAG TPA: ADOP family duplicated permease [Thermoanaerobaculia bacterium]|nr:ADOP family duplicated permease [Thermoanaerobaculia bacterium]
MRDQTDSRRLRRFGERSVEEDVARELEFHLAMRTDELIAEGWSPVEARREAERLFGDRPVLAARCHDEELRRRRTREKAHMLDTLRQDLKFAVRQLISRPGFTAAALLTLMLGIGATSALFSLVDGVLLRPFPWPQPERVVAVAEVTAEGRLNAVSTPNFEDWRQQASSLESLSVYSGSTSAVLVGDEALHVPAYTVAGDFLRVFGIVPQQGRDFVAEELQPGGDPAVLVSDRFYRRHLDPGVALSEQTVELDGRSFRVIGVTPRGFEFPAGADLWLPRELWTDPSTRTAHNWRVVARLAPDATLADARTEMSQVAARLQQEHTGDNDAFDVSVVPIREVLVGASRKPLLLLLGAAALVLLVSASNIAGALLARSFGRRTELATRSALGAERGRLVRQLLTESTLLTVCGGALGLGLAHLAIGVVRASEPGKLPRLDQVAIDSRVLLFTLAVSLATGVVFGLVPALSVSRVGLRDALAEGGRTRLGGGRSRGWSLLVGAEVAVALVLLVGAGLLLESLWKLLRVDPGFRAARVLTQPLATPEVATPSEYDEVVYRELEQQVGTFLARFEEELSGVGGVRRVALTNSLPLASSDPNGTVCLTDAGDCFETDDAGVRGYGSYRVVSDDYFAVMGISVLAGRTFERGDRPGAAHVAVVSELFARETWPDQVPIGQRIRPVGMDLHDEVPATVVGVVADVRHRGLDASPSGTFYLSIHQRPWRGRWAMALFESATDAAAIVGPVRETLRTRYPRLPVELVAMETFRHDAVAEERFTSAVLGAFAAVALVLAAVGIWSVVSYQVAQRTRELGIRIALGAAPGGVLRLVIVDVLRIVGVGGALGVVASLGLSRMLESQLHEVSARDPATFLVVAGMLLLAALAASLAPALRATRIDPILAMTDG